MKSFAKKPLNSFQIIVLGFAGVIFAGALLLMLPIASESGRMTPFLNALFTSTTSVCVTGLIVVDTGTYWSAFGQAVILVLIQIGGMGVVTVAAAVTIVSGRKIGLMQRSTCSENKRNRSPHWLYHPWDNPGGTVRSTPAGSGILPGLWPGPRTLDGGVPFHFRLLQRRNRSDGHPGSLFFPHWLCRTSTG